MFVSCSSLSFNKTELVRSTSLPGPQSPDTLNWSPNRNPKQLRLLLEFLASGACGRSATLWWLEICLGLLGPGGELETERGHSIWVYVKLLNRTLFGVWHSLRSGQARYPLVENRIASRVCFERPPQGFSVRVLRGFRDGLAL